MKKILIVNSYYGFGSTGKIVQCLNDFLKSTDFDVYSCYAWTMDKNTEKEAIKYGNTLDKYCSGLLTRITGNHYGYAFISTTKLISIVKRIKPDIIHVHCINSYDVNLLRFFTYVSSHNIKLIITEHAEFYHTGSCPYSHDCNQWIEGCKTCPDKYYACKSRFVDAARYNYERMRKAFSGFDDITFVSVSPWLLNRTRKSNITKKFSSRTILNGINVNTFHYYKEQDIEPDVREFFSMTKNVIHVTSNFDSAVKGGKYIEDLAKKNPEINFIVIGPGHTQVEENNIKRIPFITDMKKLAQFYSLADLTVMASNRETFGMSVAESLCCGTPIIGFVAGGPESVTIPQYSSFVEYGNIEALNITLHSFLERKYDKKTISLQAIQKYSAENMAIQYYKLYEEVLNGHSIK